jgi:hypothetical protein
MGRVGTGRARRVWGEPIALGQALELHECIRDRIGRDRAVDRVAAGPGRRGSERRARRLHAIRLPTVGEVLTRADVIAGTSARCMRLPKAGTGADRNALGPHAPQ